MLATTYNCQLCGALIEDWLERKSEAIFLSTYFFAPFFWLETKPSDSSRIIQTHTLRFPPQCG